MWVHLRFTIFALVFFFFFFSPASLVTTIYQDSLKYYYAFLFSIFYRTKSNP